MYMSILPIPKYTYIATDPDEMLSFASNLLCLDIGGLLSLVNDAETKARETVHQAEEELEGRLVCGSCTCTYTLYVHLQTYMYMYMYNQSSIHTYMYIYLYVYYMYVYQNDSYNFSTPYLSFTTICKMSE